MRLGKLTVLAAAVGLGMAAMPARQANASVEYQYVTSAPTLTATPGSTMTIPVFLQETLTGGSTSIINSDGGVAGAGFKMVMDSGTATLMSVNPDTTDFQGPTNPSVNGNVAGLQEAIGTSQSSGILTGNTGGGSFGTAPNEVYLGNVVINPGSGTSSFRITAYDPSGGNTLTNNNLYDLDITQTSAPAYVGTTDPANSVPNSFTVSTPEPASISLLGLGALGLLARRRRIA